MPSPTYSPTERSELPLESSTSAVELSPTDADSVMSTSRPNKLCTTHAGAVFEPLTVLPLKPEKYTEQNQRLLQKISTFNASFMSNHRGTMGQ